MNGQKHKRSLAEKVQELRTSCDGKTSRSSSASLETRPAESRRSIYGPSADWRLKLLSVVSECHNNFAGRRKSNSRRPALLPFVNRNYPTNWLINESQTRLLFTWAIFSRSTLLAFPFSLVPASDRVPDETINCRKFEVFYSNKC